MPFVSTVNMNRGDHWAGGGGLQHKLLAISQIRPECPSQDLKGISSWKFYFYHHDTVSEHCEAGLSQSVDPYKRQENVQMEALRHCTNKWMYRPCIWYSCEITSRQRFAAISRRPAEGVVMVICPNDSFSFTAWVFAPRGPSETTCLW